MAKRGRPHGWTKSLLPVPNERTCNTCKNTLPINSFRKGRTRRDGTNYYRYDCLECERNKAREYEKTYRAERDNRALHLKRFYNITPQEWDFIFEQQGKKCAICRVDKKIGTGWVTDHNHETGKVRGILCTLCNTFLGQAKDSVAVLISAMGYLKEHENINSLIEVI